LPVPHLVEPANHSASYEAGVLNHFAGRDHVRVRSVLTRLATQRANGLLLVGVQSRPSQQPLKESLKRPWRIG
jgi:hypothetical protein